MSEDYAFLFRRRHALHRKNRAVWERTRDAYSGGADYIRQALVRHVSEVELEFEERLNRAYYFNYPRKIARIITQYVLSVEPQRENADRRLCEDFSRDGMRVNEVMRQFSTLLNLYGSAALIVDMPFFEGGIDPERQKRENLRPFAKAVSPLEIADWGCGEDGKLDWILLEEEALLDRGPFRPSGTARRRKLWTREEFMVFEQSRNGGTELLRRGKHNLGQVPAVFLSEPDGFGIHSRHYFEDVVRISDAILNNESEAQMNLVKQMFGLLVISEGFARGAKPSGGASGHGGSERFSHILARSAAIWETPEEKGISRYIAPSGAETTAIREENTMLKKELFDVVGMAVQSQSKEAQTAESKAWDHHNVRQFLASRVDLLEQAELAAWRFMALYDPAVSVPKLAYNRDFAVVDLANSIGTLLQLRELSDGPHYREELARAGLLLLDRIQKIAPERREKILAELACEKEAARV